MDSQKIRASTNERLRAAGAPECSTSLPVLLPQGERPVSPVLKRALVLGLVAMAAGGLDADSVQQELKRFSLEDELTALEAACINAHEGLDLSVEADLSWEAEACRALAWALGLAPALPVRDDGGEWEGEFVELLKAGSAGVLEKRAAPRSAEQLVLEADFYRCYRSIYRELTPPDAAVGMEPQVGPLPAQTVLKRAKALVWLLVPTTPWDSLG